jgi:hypothetical protein
MKHEDLFNEKFWNLESKPQHIEKSYSDKQAHEILIHILKAINLLNYYYPCTIMKGNLGYVFKRLVQIIQFDFHSREEYGL